jgi:hypothetical protein
MKTSEEEAMIVELSRVIDNTIKQYYQDEITTSYLNSLKSMSTNLFTRLKDILPENANLSSVIHFIIFVIKKYYTGINGYWHWKSNSFGNERSILLYCLDYLFGINEDKKVEDKKVILNQMFKYTETQLHRINKRYSMDKNETFETYSAADIILLIFSKDKKLCAEIKDDKYVANYRDNISQKVRTLRSDITMGGLLDLSEENNNRDSRVFGFMTDIFDNDENNIGNTDENNNGENNDVEIIDVENNDVEKNVVENNDVENNDDESNVDEIILGENIDGENNDVENNDVENNDDETNDGETNDDETNDEKITPGNTSVELTFEINDKNHLINSQILTICFILASVLIPIIFK